MPNDLPPWSAVYQQSPRDGWPRACFETLAHDLAAVKRMACRPSADPTAVHIDSRTRRGEVDHKKNRPAVLPFGTACDDAGELNACYDT